jgi:predicted TIM-barrel fold metal-dependent hydrolase
MNINKFVSADDHVQEPPDLWTKRIASQWRDQAPKIVSLEDGGAAWLWGKNAPRRLGMDVWAGREIKNEKEIETVQWEKVHPATYEPHARLKAMDDDDIQAAVLYPNFARAFVGMWLTDITGENKKLESEFNVACIQAYNDFIAEFSSTNAKRLIPIGMIPMESIETAVAEMKRMAKKGIRGGLIPPDPGQGRFWNDPQFEPIWKTAADLDISVNLHVGALPGVKLPTTMIDPTQKGINPGTAEATSTLQRYCTAIPVTTILWSGVFDRYPNLKFVAVETDVGWMAYIKERADWVYSNFGWRWKIAPALKHPPGEYFGRNLFATFQDDKAGVATRHLIGIDTLCWASDFPHPETTWPNTKQNLTRQFEGVPEADVRKLVCENAARLYDIPV